MTARLYLAYFDNLGFECVLDLTDIEKKAMWASLKNEAYSFPLHQMIMRAKSNPQRYPEIWSFQSELDVETLLCYSKDSPQQLADLIREHGNKVYVTPRLKEVIK